jgi:hypothetical protein
VLTNLDETAGASSYGGGLGLYNTSPSTTTYIAYNDFIQLDFANPTQVAAHTTIAEQLGNQLFGVGLGINVVVTDSNAANKWVVFGSNSPAPTSSTGIEGLPGTYFLLVSGVMTSRATFNPIVYSAGATGALGTLYKYYFVGVDCTLPVTGGVDILSVTLNPIPEPATFLMAGMALIGLGALMKRLRKKV